MSNYVSIITKKGSELIAQAAMSEAKVNIVSIAIGDGAGSYYFPDATMTGLKNEVWRGGISSVNIDPSKKNMIVARAIVPPEVGGFTMREMALFDDKENMIVVANTAEIEKPGADLGYALSLSAGIHIKLSETETDTLNIIIDPEMYAYAGDIVKLEEELKSKAPLDSPVFTGIPKTPTPDVDSDKTGVVNIEFLDTVALVDSDNHMINTENPHGVTKAQVGLSNVDNTSDEEIISAAIQAVKEQISSGGGVWYATSSTAADTDAKVATIDTTDPVQQPYEQKNGSIVIVTLTTGNTASAPMLNVEEQGAGQLINLYSGTNANLRMHTNFKAVCVYHEDGANKYWIVMDTPISMANTYFTQASSRANISSDERLEITLGKLAKWYADLNTVAFSGSYNDLTNKPSIPSSVNIVNNLTSTDTNSALSAAQGKVLNDNISQTGKIWFATCTTNNTNPAKVATIDSGQATFVQEMGTTVIVKFTDSNYAEGGYTLNVNAKGASPVSKMPRFKGVLKVQFVYQPNEWVCVGYAASAELDQYLINNSGIALCYNAYNAGNAAIAIGYSAKVDGADSTALGSNASVAGDRIMQLGSNTALSSLKCKVSLTTGSDERDKIDIEHIHDALSFIKYLKPIQYVTNMREKYLSDDEEQQELYRTYGLCDYDREAHAAGTLKGERKRVGLLAQEIQAALANVYGSADYANIVNDNLHDYDNRSEIPECVESVLTVAYERFIPFLIGAINELTERVETLEQQLGVSHD